MSQYSSNREVERAIKLMRTEARRDGMTTKDAADLLGITTDTLRRWVKEGKADARTLDGGRLVFGRAEVQRLFLLHRGQRPIEQVQEGIPL